MEITTQYAIGQTLWRIVNSKATPFEVGAILINTKGVSCGPNEYSLTPETQCFPSKEELLSFVAGEYSVNPEE